MELILFAFVLQDSQVNNYIIKLFNHILNNNFNFEGLFAKYHQQQQPLALQQQRYHPWHHVY